MITRIEARGQLLAIIISHRYDNPGTSFFSRGNLSQQLA